MNSVYNQFLPEKVETQEDIQIQLGLFLFHNVVFYFNSFIKVCRQIYLYFIVTEITSQMNSWIICVLISCLYTIILIINISLFVFSIYISVLNIISFIIKMHRNLFVENERDDGYSTSPNSNFMICLIEWTNSTSSVKVLQYMSSPKKKIFTYTIITMVSPP